MRLSGLYYKKGAIKKLCHAQKSILQLSISHENFLPANMRVNLYDGGYF